MTVEKIVDRPVEKIVEKIVDRPVEKIVTVERIVDRPIEKIVTVEKIIEKQVDNPANMARIRELEAEVGQIAGLRSRIQSFEAAPAKTVEKVVTVEKQIDNPVHLARVKELEGELVRIRNVKPAEPAFDAAAARAAFGSAIKQDDLKVVEGIGPKIEELFHNAGIMTWRQLANTDPAHLKEILDAAGPRYQIHNPATWPSQSALAADGKWAELKALTDALTAGRE